MMTDFIAWVENGVTPGAIGVWGLLAAFLIAWWKGLPPVIEALVNRQSKIEERLGAEMDAMSRRWEERLETADKQHKACHEAQEALRERVVAQDGIIAQQNDTIARQTAQIVGLTEKVSALKITNEMLQMREAQRELDGGSDSAISDAMNKLRKVQ